jgi:hypothetical protein
MFMLGSYCLVAITGSGLGIIYNHDDNNDDVTLVLSMFMLLVLLITRSYVLIETWRTTHTMKLWERVIKHRLRRLTRVTQN